MADFKINNRSNNSKSQWFTPNEDSALIEQYCNDFAIITSSFNSLKDGKEAKDKAWDRVLMAVNACGVQKRNLTQVKARISKLKTVVRQKHRKKAKEQSKTGGGQANEVKITPLEEMLASCLGSADLYGCDEGIDSMQIIDVVAGSQPQAPKPELQFQIQNTELQTEIQNTELQTEIQNPELLTQIQGDDIQPQTQTEIAVASILDYPNGTISLADFDELGYSSISKEKSTPVKILDEQSFQVKPAFSSTASTFKFSTRPPKVSHPQKKRKIASNESYLELEERRCQLQISLLNQEVEKAKIETEYFRIKQFNALIEQQILIHEAKSKGLQISIDCKTTEE